MCACQNPGPMTMAGRNFFTRRHLAALLVWALVACVGTTFLAQARLEQLRDTFETDGRTVHRRLSQWVVQYDAVMATLALLQPPAVDAATGNTARTAAAQPRPMRRPELWTSMHASFCLSVLCY